MTKPEKSLSLHERLLNEFLGYIVHQQWPPGYRLPFETELAETHGVSRMTMNKVLTQLTREGYLVRRRKLGTFVAEPRAQTAVLAITDIEAEVGALGLDWHFELQTQVCRKPSHQEIEEARITDANADVLALMGVHYAGDHPFCLEDRIVNLSVVPAAIDQDFTNLAPSKWLLGEVPWTSAEHRISAINARGTVAKLLGLSGGEACLDIARRTELAGDWVTLVHQTYPGERHQLQAQFEPRSEDGPT